MSEVDRDVISIYSALLSNSHYIVDKCEKLGDYVSIIIGADRSIPKYQNVTMKFTYLLLPKGIKKQGYKRGRKVK